MEIKPETGSSKSLSVWINDRLVTGDPEASVQIGRSIPLKYGAHVGAVQIDFVVFNNPLHVLEVLNRPVGDFLLEDMKFQCNEVLDRGNSKGHPILKPLG